MVAHLFCTKNFGFWIVKGLGDIPLYKSIFTGVPQGKICEKCACGRPQAVLAIPVLEYKRFLFAQADCPKTNMGDTAHTDKKI